MHIPGSDRDAVLRQVQDGVNLGTAMLSMAAERDGATVERLTSRLALARSGERTVIIDGCFCTETSVGTQIIKDKLLAKEYLLAEGIRTPRGAVADSAEEAVAIAASLGGNVVVKPRRGLKGLGVSADLSTEQEIRKAYRHARTDGTDVLVEEHIDIQEELRCLTSDTHCDGVVRRVLPSVTGDGISSIRTLIAHENAARDKNPALYRRYTPIDHATESHLARIGLTPDDVLDAGRTVTVRNIGGISSGGVPDQVREEVTDEVIRTATRAVAAIPGLTWAGVDVAIDQSSGAPYVLELNADAGFGAATYPHTGVPRDVAATMWTLMKGISTPTDPSTAVPPTLLTEPRRLDADVPYLSETSGRLGDLLRDHARTRGHEILDIGSGMIQISTDSGTRLFTRFGTSERDLVTAVRSVRRFGWQRKLLTHANIPRPGGRLVRTPAALRSFLDGPRRPVTLLPADKPWTSSAKIYGMSDDPNLIDSLAGAPEWFVQNRPQGPRLALVAAPDRVFFATITGDSTPPTSAQFDDASTAAVRAVAAVPGLRWAAVDVCIQVGRNGWRGRVEGMTIAPRFRSTDQVIAGRPLDFLDWLIDSTG